MREKMDVFYHIVNSLPLYPIQKFKKEILLSVMEESDQHGPFYKVNYPDICRMVPGQTCKLYLPENCLVNQESWFPNKTVLENSKFATL